MARNFIAASSEKVAFGDIATDGLTNMTVSVWMKRNATSKGVYIQKGASGTAEWYILLFTDGKCYMKVTNGASGFMSIANNDTSWHHLVLAYDGSLADANRVKMYNNKVLESAAHSAGVGTTTATDAAVLSVGYWVANPLYSDGTIANVKVWAGVTLSADEIISDYYGRIPQRGSLVSYAPLGYGSPEPDFAGATNGTLSGTPTIADGPPEQGPAWGFDEWSLGGVAAATGPPVGSLSMSGLGR